ncbi:hypothetical protein [Hydrotalea sp.]|uniref:hypothetical protein n=1 Tax=Hydrotalea sp. TaxID=2881279 RepID=UPI00260D0F48|nr:hypothetical protein [Hydrotalea sp.]
MKSLIVLFLLIPFYPVAQPAPWVNDILNGTIIKIPVYQIDTISTNVLYLPMPFAKSDFADTTGVSRLQQADILSVDLVFTDYPASNSLKVLNAARFKSLQQLIPFIHNQFFTQWRMIRQTKGKDAVSSEKLMHGFVIHYRSIPTGVSIQKELALVQQTTMALAQIKQKPVLQISVNPVNNAKTSKKIRYWDEIYGSSAPTTPMFYIKNRPVLQIADTVFTTFDPSDSMMQVPYTIALQKKILTRQQQIKFQKAEQLYCLLGPPRKWADEGSQAATLIAKSLPLPDTSLLHSLQQQSFKNALLVVDVTASMSLYTVQLLHWLQQIDTLHAITQFACFNDGNDIPTERKILGNTGGIYIEPYSNMNNAAVLMETAMHRGSGGDTPENVCEALIQSIAACAACEEVILIADNWAPVRDIELLQQIKKPVQIMICGGTIGVHPDYVTIACKTQGSLRFTDGAITDFSALKNGGVMQIRSLPFRLDKSGKVLVANLSHQQ